MSVLIDEHWRPAALPIGVAKIQSNGSTNSGTGRSTYAARFRFHNLMENERNDQTNGRNDEHRGLKKPVTLVLRFRTSRRSWEGEELSGLI
ncbi:unnamed protein product [Calypogeia fissa]